MYSLFRHTLILLVLTFTSATANAAIVFDDPAAAGDNADFINQQISENGKFIKPSGGKIYINKTIVCPAFCQIIGETDAHSPIVISQGFSGDRVIRTAFVQPAIEIRDVKFLFDQDLNASDRSQLVPFPPFMKELPPRAKLIDVSISGGIDGIIADSNAGGLYMERVKLGNFGTNLLIDGALDFVFLDMIEVWPFDFSGPQGDPINPGLIDIWSDGQTIGYHFKHLDGLTAGNLATFRAKAIIEEGAAAPFGSINSLQLDGRHAGLVMKGGHISIANSYSTSDLENDVAIRMQGGSLNIANLRVTGSMAANSTEGLITQSAGELNIANLIGHPVNGHTNVIVKNIEDSIQNLYRTILRRPADPAGYAIWLGVLNSGTAIEQIAISFLNSEEARLRYEQNFTFNNLSTDDQVAMVYRAVLARTASDAEIAGWTGSIESGTSISVFVSTVLNSAEFKRR